MYLLSLKWRHTDVTGSQNTGNSAAYSNSLSWLTSKKHRSSALMTLCDHNSRWTGGGHSMFVVCVCMCVCVCVCVGACVCVCVWWWSWSWWWWEGRGQKSQNSHPTPTHPPWEPMNLLWISSTRSGAANYANIFSISWRHHVASSPTCCSHDVFCSPDRVNTPRCGKAESMPAWC